MRPAFDAGSAMVAVRVPTESVGAGDVIVYQAPVDDQRVVAHRVIKVVEAGDANDGPDPWLARLQDETVWKVRGQVPRLGHALVFLYRPEPRLAMAMVVLGCALAAGLRVIWSARGKDG